MDASRVSVEKQRALWEKAHALRLAPTPAEEALWEEVRRHHVLRMRFQRQYVIGPFIVDFYCRAAKLVVEVDGEVHMGQEVRDAERDAFIVSQGFRVIRFRNDEVLGNVGEVVNAIRATAAAHPTPRPSPRLGEGGRRP